jgi:SNF2 family DNA or RNA helicase
MSNYDQFLSAKKFRFSPEGFDVKESELNEKLFPFQRAIVKWALFKGKAAIFADTGLGKSFMQIEWAWQVFQRTGNRVLILAPLCVADQTVKEADKLGYSVKYVRSFEKDGSTGIYITNYEMLDYFEDAIREGYFDGIVLDESSIIKHKDSKTRTKIIEISKNIPYRLSATATPSPNDYMELGNQSEFLGVMRMTEMLSMFFVHDSGETSKWRLKGHGERKFWQWLATWAVTIKKPSDLGFSDDGYELPGLNIVEVLVKSEYKPIETTGLSGRNEARKLSINERVNAAAEIVNKGSGPFIVWCNLNEESEKLENAIDNSTQIVGSYPVSKKELYLNQFTNGEIQRLITKPSIAGFGLNWQHCNNVVFVGLNDSYEQLYQAIRRCYRFGQTKVVNVYLITSSLEGAVRENIQEKERKAQEMIQQMVDHMKDFTKREIKTTVRETTDYIPSINFELPEFLK